VRSSCREGVDREPNFGGTCAPLELSGTALLGTRNLLDLAHLQGELILRKY
jgi:hypothetical protein